MQKYTPSLVTLQQKIAYRKRPQPIKMNRPLPSEDHYTFMKVARRGAAFYQEDDHTWRLQPLCNRNEQKFYSEQEYLFTIRHTQIRTFHPPLPCGIRGCFMMAHTAVLNYNGLDTNWYMDIFCLSCLQKRKEIKDEEEEK